MVSLASDRCWFLWSMVAMLCHTLQAHVSSPGLQCKPAARGLALIQKLVLGHGAKLQLVSPPEHSYFWWWEKVIHLVYSCISKAGFTAPHEFGEGREGRRVCFFFLNHASLGILSAACLPCVWARLLLVDWYCICWLNSCLFQLAPMRQVLLWDLSFWQQYFIPWQFKSQLKRCRYWCRFPHHL